MVATAAIAVVASFPLAGLAQEDTPLPDGTLEPDVSSALDQHQDPPKEVVAPPPPGVFVFFPVQGEYSYVDTFGAPRSDERTHTGTDIIAARGTPVVAVASGVVIAAEASDGISGTFVKIRHTDGAVSSYVHLNNDTPGTDDGLGAGIAEDIEVGVTVEAGTVIGYVGDSGNAEKTVPHLHFAYSPDGSTAMNPYPELRLVEGFAATEVLLASLPFTGLEVLGLTLLAAVLSCAGAGVLLVTRSNRWIREELA